MSLISIIVPVYNLQNYLVRCLESIINQTYSNLEIILVNDGSTDDSLKICEKYKSEDSRIKIISKENGGLSSARNAGLEIFQGEYITFIDGDDWVHSKYIEYLFKTLDITKSDIALAKIKRVDAFSNKEHKETVKDIEIYNNIEAVNHFFSGKLSCSATSKIYKRSIFADKRFRNVYAEDSDLIYELFYISEKVSIVNLELYFYFQRNGGLTQSNEISRKISNIKDVYDVVSRQEQFLIVNQASSLKDFYISAIWQYTKYIIELHGYDQDLKVKLISEIKRYYKLLNKDVKNISFYLRFKLFSYRYLRFFLNLVKKQW